MTTCARHLRRCRALARNTGLIMGPPSPLTSRLEPDILLRAKQDFLMTDSDSDFQ